MVLEKHLGRSKRARLRKYLAGKVTAVIFRKWRDTGNVVAIFPAIPGDVQGRYCQMYEHVGQHGDGDYLLVVGRTVLATPAEYADLKRELEAEPYKYQLLVYENRTQGHIDEYFEALELFTENFGNK
jgi:hypothetical protein